MSLLISDNGASIKLTFGTQIRNIIKLQIVEIAVIKTNIIKIDSIMGALYTVYIPFSDVTSPITASPEALRDTLIAFLQPVTGGGTIGGATEVNQTLQIELLNTMGTELLSINDSLSGLNDKTNGSPQIIEDVVGGITYKGYAQLGASLGEPVWAIQRIERSGATTKFQWANGNKNRVNRWELRETLTYL